MPITSIEDIKELADFLVDKRVKFDENKFKNITNKKRSYKSVMKKMLKNINKINVDNNKVFRIVVNHNEMKKIIDNIDNYKYKMFVDDLMYLIYNIHNIQGKFKVEDEINKVILNKLIRNIKFIVFSNGLFYLSVNLDYDDIKEQLININSNLIRVGKEKVEGYVIIDGNYVKVGEYELGATIVDKKSDYRRTIQKMINEVKNKHAKLKGD